MKIYCVQLILFLLTHKLTGARDEIFFQEEIIQPELFDLASKANLKENMLLEEIGYKKVNEYEEKAIEKLQKEQAIQMSAKRKLFSESKSEVDKRLKNSLRVNRLEMIENKDLNGVPSLLSLYLDKKNENELRKLSQENLLPNQEGVVRINKEPSHLVFENHHRISKKLHNPKSAATLRSLAASRKDSQYFQSSQYLSNRLNNTLRKNRLTKFSKSELDADAPVMLANYLRQKANSERSLLINQGILPPDYDLVAPKQDLQIQSPKQQTPTSKIAKYDPSKRKPLNMPYASNNPFFQSNLKSFGQNQENDQSELEYSYDEPITTRPLKPKVFVLEDKKNGRSPVNRNKASSTFTTTTTNPSIIVATTPTTTISTTTTTAVASTTITTDIESTVERTRNNPRTNQNKRLGKARIFKQQTTTAEPFYEDYPVTNEVPTRRRFQNEWPAQGRKRFPQVTAPAYADTYDSELDESTPRTYANQRRYQNGRLAQGRKVQQQSSLLQDEDLEEEFLPKNQRRFPNGQERIPNRRRPHSTTLTEEVEETEKPSGRINPNRRGGGRNYNDNNYGSGFGNKRIKKTTTTKQSLTVAGFSNIDNSTLLSKTITEANSSDAKNTTASNKPTSSEDANESATATTIISTEQTSSQSNSTKPSETMNSTSQDDQSINLLKKFSNRNNLVQSNRVKMTPNKVMSDTETLDDDFSENEEFTQFDDYPHYRYAGKRRNLFARNRFNYY